MASEEKRPSKQPAAATPSRDSAQSGERPAVITPSLPVARSALRAAPPKPSRPRVESPMPLSTAARVVAAPPPKRPEPRLITVSTSAPEVVSTPPHVVSTAAEVVNAADTSIPAIGPTDPFAASCAPVAAFASAALAGPPALEHTPAIAAEAPALGRGRGASREIRRAHSSGVVVALVIGVATAATGAVLFSRTRPVETSRGPSSLPVTPLAERPAQGETKAQPTPPRPVSPALPDTLAAPAPARVAAAENAARTELDGSDAKAPTCDELLGGVAASQKAMTSYDYLRVARRETVRGNWDASQRAFCRAAQAPDASPAAGIELSQSLLARRDSVAALAWAERALAAHPTSAAALALSGDALVRTGEVEQAKQQWLRAAKLPNADHAAVTRMARANFEEAQRAAKQYDFARAERYYRRVLAFEPANAQAAAKLSETLAKMAQPKAAEYWARRAAESVGSAR